MRWLVLSVVVMLLAAGNACGDEPRGEAPKNAKEAVTSFQAEALKVVREMPRGPQRDEVLDQLANLETLSVKRIEFSAAHTRVAGSTRPEERARLFIQGKLDDLKVPGEC
jgi:hypothetical protein